MAGNFIIYYNGREGSTAITNSLSGQQGITVPLMEDLDGYAYLPAHRARDIPAVLDAIFKTGRYNDVKLKPRQLQISDTADSPQSIGFKWRIFGDMQKISSVLLAHDVTVFCLFRRNFLDLVCSSYVHIYGNKIQPDIEVEAHPQFTMQHLNEGELQAFSAAISTQKFNLVSRWFIAIAHRQIGIRRRQEATLRALSKAGVKIKTILYEDFDAAPEPFIKNFMAELGFGADTPFNPHCDFVKVHTRPLTARIRKLDTITHGLRGLPYRYYENRHNRALARIKAMERP